jgi:hypothetical protein
MPPVAAPYPGVGGWIISYQDRFYLDAGTNYPDGNSYFQPAMNSLAGGPALWQIPVIKFPLKFGDSIYNQTNRNDSWTDLRAWINSPSYRNFYYYGHGSANVIGADVHTFDISNNVTGGKNLPGSKAYLTSQYVRDNLTFNKNAGSRPYRFVFLDGCKTANGDWPDAFGINKATNDLSYYSSASNKRHVRPSAFMGWNVTVGGSKEWGRVDKFFDFRSYWMANWSVNKGYDNDNLDAIVESARSGSGWVSSSQLWDHLRIYGYRTLKFDEYNHKGDWSQ